LDLHDVPDNWQNKDNMIDFKNQVAAFSKNLVAGISNYDALLASAPAARASRLR